MATKMHRVRVINPAEPKPKPKPKKRTPAMATTRKRKRSTKKATTTPKRRGGRRRTNPAPRRRAPARRRGRNPDGGGGGGRRSIDLMAPLRHWKPFWRLAGKMAAAWAVRRWGDPEGAVPSTATMGGRWTIKNHIIGLAAGYLSGMVAGRIRPGVGQEVYEGAVDLSVSKAWWHEVVQAIPGGATYFGSTDPALQQLLGRAQPGDTIDDGRGNRFVVQAQADGSRTMVPMMGLEPARALDGIQAARPLDGLTTARPTDGYQQRRRASYGHLTVASPAAEEAANYLRRGTTDPYKAAYLGRR